MNRGENGTNPLSARDRRLLSRVLSGESDSNIRFRDMRRLMANLGFDERIRGSHHKYSRTDIVEHLNLQPRRDGMAKTYQIRQVRRIFIKYGVTPDGIQI